MKNVSKMVFSLLALMGSLSMIAAYNAEATAKLLNILKPGILLHDASPDYDAQGFDKIGELIKQGADPYIEDAQGEPLISYALWANPPQRKLIKELKNAGVQIDLPNKFGKTVLEIASRQNDINKIRLLLSEGANPNIGFPLIDAMDNSSPELAIKILQELISSGADVNRLDIAGDTILMNAISRRNSEIVRFLLVNRANPLMRNQRNLTALGYAVEYLGPDHEIVKLLEKYLEEYQKKKLL